jgi:hypothetical protein
MGHSLKSFQCSAFVCLVLALLAGITPAPAWAQGENNSASVTLELKPIEIHYTTIGGLQYSFEEVPLTEYRQFDILVSPLRDHEATRLLKRSETASLNGTIFASVGFVGLATGVVGILTSNKDQQAGFWIAAIGGAITWDIGQLFQSEARTAKFNCVQRFNRFARGEEQVLPSAPQDEKSLLEFDKTTESETQNKKKREERIEKGVEK